MTSPQPIPNPFPGTPSTASGHLALHFVAAARCLEQYLSTFDAAIANELQSRFRFLASYSSHVRPPAAGIAQERLWWSRALHEWEQQSDASLPLCALDASYNLGFEARLAVILAGVVEEDSRFGAVFDELQAPLDGRRPTLETLGRILTTGPSRDTGDPWSLCRPLLECGLLESLNPEAPRVEQQVRVPGPVWDAIRGEPARHPWPTIRYCPGIDCPQLADLIYPKPFLDQLERVPTMLAEGRARVLVIRHGEGADFEEIAGAIARKLQRGLLLADGSVETPGTQPQGVPPALGPLCEASRALPFFVFQLKPGESGILPRLPGYTGPILAALGSEGGLRVDRRDTAISLQVPFPSRQEREHLWLRAATGTPVENLEEIRDRFQLEAGHIQRLAGAARVHAGLSGRSAVRPEDVRAAGRLLNRQSLDRLAQPINVRGSWGDLVVAPHTRRGLSDLERRCRRREHLVEHFRSRFGNGLNRGVRALFTGSSGTGKTMAASILASELGGMELYRVDLASVVNKYIGETESNLHEVLTRAEALDVILLIDEGDSLMGRRTEVKSSNDRYANLETNFLLQRLESYQGIVIVTTNQNENIDPAFQRRMDAVVQFHPPEAEGRRRIFDLHLPKGHRVEEIYLNLVSRRCIVTGGQIRNAVLHAATQALENNSPIRASHLQEALEREYQKAGATFPLAGYDPSARTADGGFADFLSALNEHRG